MDPRKAQRLITTILMTHAQALGVDTRESRVLQNAEQDLHGLVEQIIAECRGAQAPDLDEHADDAIRITREA